MMNRHPSDCRCRAVDEPVEPEPIGLPDVPTSIRVHTPGMPPFDCTLHPDGTLTAVLGGEVCRNFFTLAEMQERNWAGSRIEFDPELLPEEPAVEVVQEAIAL